MGIGLAIIFVAGVIIVSRKHKSILRAQAGLDDVHWVRDDWQPPKIELATYRVPGKVCKDLDPVEAEFSSESHTNASCPPCFPSWLQSSMCPSSRATLLWSR